MNTQAPIRVSLADINKTLWLLANPMAEMLSTNVPPGLRFMPVFVQELGDGEARLLGADLRPMTGDNDSAARLKALYADPQVLGVDLAIPSSLVAAMQAANSRLDSHDPVVSHTAAGEIFVAAVRAGLGMGLDGWLECARRLHRERYTCHVWIERDRAHVRLVDQVTRLDVVNLVDHDVFVAIDDGLLVQPEAKRPTPEEWHEKVIEYALEIGAIDLALQIQPASAASADAQADHHPTSDKPSA